MSHDPKQAVRADDGMYVRILEIEERWLRGRLNEVREELHRRRRRLSSLRIGFTQPSPQGENCMSSTSGALTLANVGDKATASVQGFDQNGQPMPADFTMPAVSFSIDNTAVATVDGGGTVTAVSGGFAELSATATSAEGVSLRAFADVTVGGIQPPPPEAPVLTSIQITFDAAAAPAVADPAAAAGDATGEPASAGADIRSPNEKLAAAVGQS